jgi:hypothetical protein
MLKKTKLPTLVEVPDRDWPVGPMKLWKPKSPTRLLMPVQLPDGVVRLINLKVPVLCQLPVRLPWLEFPFTKLNGPKL